MTLSALICTRNRAKSLGETLARIFAQRFAGGYDFEVIVVDNGSTDETRQVVEQFVERHHGVVRYCFEPRRGLSHARNTGIAEARGEIIVFTDDDVLVDADWLNQIHREFIDDPGLTMLGGRVLLARPELQEISLQTCDQRLTFAFPDNGNFAIGANMAFRRELFDRVGLFDPRLGAGRFFAGGDETDLFYRALRAGYKLHYVPNVLVYHNHDRVTAEQVCRLSYSYGKGGAAYLIKHALQGDRYAMRMIYWLLLSLPTDWLGRGENDKKELIRRRRANIRGLLMGFLAAPWVMWKRQAGEPPRRGANQRAVGESLAEQSDHLSSKI